MPIGAILLLTAATVYARQKGLRVGDALQQLNPCVACSASNRTTVVDDRDQDLPASYYYCRSEHELRLSRSSCSTCSEAAAASSVVATSLGSGGTVR